MNAAEAAGQTRKRRHEIFEEEIDRAVKVCTYILNEPLPEAVRGGEWSLEEWIVVFSGNEPKPFWWQKVCETVEDFFERRGFSVDVLWTYDSEQNVSRGVVKLSWRNG